MYGAENYLCTRVVESGVLRDLVAKACKSPGKRFMLLLLLLLLYST